MDKVCEVGARVWDVPTCASSMHWEPRAKSKAPQRRRTAKPGGCSGPRNQRASVFECGGAPPLSTGEWTWYSCGLWKAASRGGGSWKGSSAWEPLPTQRFHAFAFGTGNAAGLSVAESVMVSFELHGCALRLM